MEKEQIFEVIQKLIGPVTPMADAAIDSNRYENMEKFAGVYKLMEDIIEDVADEYENSPYGSAKRIGELARKNLEV